MTEATRTVDHERLRALYKADSAAESILDYFAARQYDSATTKVERLQQVLNQEEWGELSRGDVVRVLKSLDDIGCGNFIAGRRGHPSRFQWRVSLCSVGRAGSDPAEVVEEVEPEEELIDDADDALQHAFHLRPDLVVYLNLPPDLTSEEAARLAKFVKALPFGRQAAG